MQKEALLLTPLHEEHIKLKARMIPFDGFDMPVQYSGIIEEHTAVREAVGPDMTLMLDPVFGYDRDGALKVGRAIEKLDFL